MVTYSVHLTETAKKDLIGIYRYIAEQLYAPTDALSLLDEIDRSIKKLEKMPTVYGLVADKRLANLGYRKMAVKNYLIFFTVDTPHYTIIIERILYGRRNWLSIL